MAVPQVAQELGYLLMVALPQLASTYIDTPMQPQRPTRLFNRSSRHVQSPFPLYLPPEIFFFLPPCPF